jgi:hypothetical protein
MLWSALEPMAHGAHEKVERREPLLAVDDLEVILL